MSRIFFKIQLGLSFVYAIQNWLLYIFTVENQKPPANLANDPHPSLTHILFVLKDLLFLAISAFSFFHFLTTCLIDDM